VFYPFLPQKHKGTKFLKYFVETSEKVIARSEATKQSFQNINKIKIASPKNGSQ
jgi:hypothetical protein